MPNWCSTQMTVKGDNEELKKFLDGIAKDDKGYYSIVKSYYPTPEPLLDTVHGWTTDEEKMAQRVAQQAENIANYGYADWYEWNIANWGSKWSDSDTDLLFYMDNITGWTEAEFSFLSAWSPLTQAFLHISKMFPNLYFAFEHNEEAGFYLVVEVIRNGELLAEAVCEPSEEYTDTDTDSEMFSDSYSEWCIGRLDRLWDEVNAELDIKGHTL